jgi:hypothetical protein
MGVQDQYGTFAGMPDGVYYFQYRTVNAKFRGLHMMVVATHFFAVDNLFIAVRHGSLAFQLEVDGGIVDHAFLFR